MSVKATSLLVTTADLNSIDYLEEFREFDLKFDNTLVDARGIADRYLNHQMTKQKQSVDVTYHWYDTVASLDLQATNLNISLWTLGGTAYLSQIKSGTFDVVNSGPETSGIAETYEFPQPTATDWTLTSDIMIISEAAFSYLMSTATQGQFAVTVAFTFSGEPVTADGILNMTSHKVVRGEVQMENVTIKAKGGTPTTSGDTTSLLYLALVGAAVTSYDIDTGVNEYATGETQTAMISRYNLNFRDKSLIEQVITLELQGGQTVTAPS